MKKSLNMIDKFYKLSNKILANAGSNTLRTEFIINTLELISDFINTDKLVLCEVIDSKFFYYILHEGETDIIRNASKNLPEPKTSLIDLFYRDYIAGKKSFFSKYIDSDNILTINDLPQFLNINEENFQDIQFKIERNYESVLIVPFSIENKDIGFLKFKASVKNFFTEEKIKYAKGIGIFLGNALAHHKAQSALRERIKELSSLYQIGKIAEEPEVSLKYILQKIVEILPPAWQYPDIACARITVDNIDFESKNFAESEYMISANIITDNLKRGSVEIYYSENRLDYNNTPFLKEEHNLIKTIARQIGLILERITAEEDRKKLQEQLRHADRLATIGQLSAGVAHEINEPLGNVLGFAQLIKKNPEADNQTKEDNEKIIKAALHAREIVKKLMLFSRQMPTKKTETDLNKIVKEGLYLLQARCDRKGIALKRKLDDSVPIFTADSSQIYQVLVNLVVNAVQATPEKGSITIETTHDNEFIYLIVSDTGIGMTKEVMNQIFIPFFTTKDVDQGTGLGLPVVHGIVVSHGGTISVDSKVSEGSVFTIKFPKSK